MKTKLTRISVLLMLAFATTVSLSSCGDKPAEDGMEQAEGKCEEGKCEEGKSDEEKKCEEGKCEEGKCEEGKK